VARVLLIHHDAPTLRRLTGSLKDRHEVVATGNLLKGIRHIAKDKPEVVVVGHDAARQEGIKLLTYLRDNQIKAAVVAVYSRNTKSSQPLLIRLGAKALVPAAADEAQLDEAIRKAMVLHAAQLAGPPPVTDEEQNSNLSLLERNLNRQMKCFAGANLVFIQSQLLGRATTKPRIMLRCPLRAEYGLNRDVYYEYIRDVCCGDPEMCEAYRQFNADREAAS
jgi:chemotaxis response regulator CheB